MVCCSNRWCSFDYRYQLYYSGSFCNDQLLGICKSIRICTGKCPGRYRHRPDYSYRRADCFL
ncbi:hypothetical protein D3C86_1933200 [compost metagenome]